MSIFQTRKGYYKQKREDKKEDKKWRNQTIPFPMELWNIINRMAKNESRGFSAMVIMILQNHLGIKDEEIGGE